MSSPGHICLITPGHLATNPRIVKEAQALTRAGYAITILHGDYLPGARAHDKTLTDPRWKTIAAPFGPRQNSKARYLAQTARRKSARLGARLGLAPTALVHMAQSPVGPELVKAALTVTADLYIAHYVAALPAAAASAKAHHKPYAFDAEDFHLGDLPDARAHAFERRLIRHVEARFLPGAAYVSAAAPGIAQAYQDAYGIERPTVVLNTFPLSQAPDSASAAGSVSPRPTLYWFSQTIGANRGLECAIEALARAQSGPHLHLRGRFSDAHYEAVLKQHARAYGVADRLHFHATAAPDDMARLAAAYDAGLACEVGETPNHLIGLSNKQFTYLLAGVPVLLSDIPSHIAFAAELGDAAFLFRSGDAADLARAMDQVFASAARLANARAHAFALGQSRFNWEAEAELFLSCVRRALGEASMGNTHPGHSAAIDAG